MSYGSPRWSNEILDCSMPLTFDTYSNCSFNCQYCEPAGAPILTNKGLVPIEDIAKGDTVIGWSNGNNKQQVFKEAKVLDTFVRQAPVIKLTLASGYEIECTKDHHWFMGRSGSLEYKPARVGRDLHQLFAIQRHTESSDYKLGYFQGVVDGDGTVTNKYYKGKGTHHYHSGNIQSIRLAMKDQEPLDRFFSYSVDLGLKPYRGTAVGLPCVRVYGPACLDVYTNRLDTLLDGSSHPTSANSICELPNRVSTDYWRGWLAGMFDAEGSCSGGSFRIAQYKEVNPIHYSNLVKALQLFNFDIVKEETTIRIKKAQQEVLRFWNLTNPTLFRRVNSLLMDKAIYGKQKDKIVGIEEVGTKTVYSIHTSTGNYIAHGYMSRNCFSQNIRGCQPGGGGEAYWNKEVDGVNPDSIKRLFLNADNPQTEGDRQFSPYIAKRYMMQWGGLSDQFDLFEKEKGVTLELLRFFNTIRYPLSFSTKSTWWIQDKRYLDAIKGMQPYWHFKFSIITNDDKQAKLLERGAPSSSNRLNAIKTLADMGFHVTLRLRPFIPGISTKGYRQLIKRAAEAGADSVSTEFLCLEGRASGLVRYRYEKMSEMSGFDLMGYYKKQSTGGGYMRLNRGVKRPYMEDMKELCDKLGIRFHVSDAHFKELGSHGSCCGVPKDMHYFPGQMTNALITAKQTGKPFSYDTIQDDVHGVFSQFRWERAEGFDTVGLVHAAKKASWTMEDFIKVHWNDPKSNHSPYKYFGGIVIPKYVNKQGNVVYGFV